MATIIELPSQEARVKQRIKETITRALENHSSETRDKKRQAVLDLLNRFSTIKPISVIINLPAGEPALTPGQIQAVTETMEQLAEACRQQTRMVLEETILLQLQVIDLETAP